MIVGTAGHIDHGKSALIRALTGVDTDRLPEEKARGISIELGYAYLDVPPTLSHPAPGRIGFVDVPGHERLVRTMLAGATGIDYALLVIAADDGVMPQTREHLAVLALLGLERGAVVLTKADRADVERLAEVHRQVDELLAGTPLATLPRLSVSSTTGAGLDVLRALLFDAARGHSRPIEAATEGFRLAVDRSFTLAGIGTIVTGTVHAGRVAIGDELVVAPVPGKVARVRVRSLHAADRPVEAALRGERCALALAGVDRHDIGRGDWLVSPAVALATDRIDVRIAIWRDEARSLRSGAPVHVHLGTADVLASVAILRADESTPGDPADAARPGRTAWAQLVLREPIAAWHGDRVVLRDESASRTIAGGRVLDPEAPTRYRRTPQRLAELVAWQAPSAAERLERLVDAAPLGVSIARWSVAEGLLETGKATGWRIAAHHASRIEERVVAALQAFDAGHPELPGIDAAALRRIAAPRLADPLWRELLAGLRSAGRIALQASFVQLPGRAEARSAHDAALLQRVEPLLAAAGHNGAWVRDLARSLALDEGAVRAALARLARQGALHQIVRDLYVRVDTLNELATLIRASVAEPTGGISAGAFRDAAGLGRKRAIQLLEYFDRLGVSKRVGDVRQVRADSQLFAAT